MRNRESPVRESPARSHPGLGKHRAAFYPKQISACFCLNHSDRQTPASVAWVRSPNNDLLADLNCYGRLNSLHELLFAIGEDFVNTTILGLQNTLARIQNDVPCCRERMAGDGREKVFQLYDVILLLW